MILVLLLLVPLLAALLCLLAPHQQWFEGVTIGATLLGVVLAVAVVAAVLTGGHVQGLDGWLYADALSALSVSIIAFVGATAALYSIGYLPAHLRLHGGPQANEREDLRRYYLLFNLFLFAMLVVPVSNSLGVLWIAIEGTTLASLFLVSFYRTDEALEAAWKYVIIGSVGIALALFGTILVYYSAVRVLGTTYDLNWSRLVPVAARLDPHVMQLGFLFIVVGFGTKAGLAPMHTWLPDAHSEAPTPISALLSGVLLNTAMYAILRYDALATPSLGPHYTHTLLLAFGLISLIVAALFIWYQRDYKRLLAYSSVEHMGIVAIGVAFGGPLGLFGALLQMVGHAVTKSLMFFVAGHLVLRYDTKEIDRVAGVAQVMPATGTVLMVGALALTGSPPFGIFISEISILTAGMTGGQAPAALCMLVLLALIFVRFLRPINQMVFGQPSSHHAGGDSGWTGYAAMLCSLVPIVGLGFFIPTPLGDLLHQSAVVLGGA